MTKPRSRPGRAILTTVNMGQWFTATWHCPHKHVALFERVPQGRLVLARSGGEFRDTIDDVFDLDSWSYDDTEITPISAQKQAQFEMLLTHGQKRRAYELLDLYCG